MRGIAMPLNKSPMAKPRAMMLRGFQTATSVIHGAFLTTTGTSIS